MSFQMKVHPNNVGKIIGPRGATIKSLQSEYNVRISISKDNDESGMRLAEINGDDQRNVDSAVDAIKMRFDNSRDNSLDRNRPRRENYNDNYGRSENFQRNFRNENRFDNDRGRFENRQSDFRGPPRNFQRDDWNSNRNQRTYEQNNNNVAVKRSNDDWEEGEVTPTPPPIRNAPKLDDWEMTESATIPSVNIYTQSTSTSQDYERPKGSYEKKFRGRDDYGANRSYNSGGRDYNNSGARDYNSGSRDYNNSGRNNYNRSSNYDFGSSSKNYGYETVVKDEPTEPTVIDWDKINAEADAARKARWESCPLLLKDFYNEHPKTKAMTKEEVEKFRLENNKIQVSRVFEPEADPDTMPKPITKFEYGFEAWPDLLDELKKAGFERPSPIQSQMWPILLKGEDCIGIAQTGTGKTLAFLLPALIHTDGQPHPRGLKARGGPNVLVLAPTRELAIQIEKEVAKYQFRNIRAVCLYGGNDRKKQIEVVESGVEVIIATPGRLNDLVSANYIKIESITYLILDEADRMLDMGFEPQIRKILLDIRDDRQTVMTSATWPSGVRRLASSYMKNPYQVVIGSLDLAATHTVTQRIEIMSEDDKYERIVRLVKDEMTPDDKAIIFCAKKDRADSLSADFALAGVNCQAIHGNREQRDREQALEDIKSGEVKILIATDVASRGIDIQDITMVVNYDFPRNIEEYVHRVGRTGRAGRSGTSISFFTRSDWGSAKELIEILKEAEQEIPDELVAMAERFQIKKESGGFRGGRGRGRGGNRY